MAMTVGLLLVAAIAPYVNSLGGSFHFDDEWEIVRNAGIRSWGEFVRRPASRSVPRFINYLNFLGCNFSPGNICIWKAPRGCSDNNSQSGITQYLVSCSN